MRIVLLGAPGAGKGTQCKYIVDKYGLMHLSSGDILRRHRAEGTDLGKKAQSYMDSGGLVPDTLIIEMMIGEIGNAPKSGYVLDGFPRTVEQATELDKAMEQKKQKLDAIINLAVNEEVVVNRITGRRSCPKCGAVYHVGNMPPKAAGICDHDGVELVQRKDDTKEVVINRLANYHQQTAPVVEYYKKRGNVVDVDANKEAEQVRQLLFEKLDALS